jgi:hypothetical protein
MIAGFSDMMSSPLYEILNAYYENEPKQSKEEETAQQVSSKNNDKMKNPSQEEQSKINDAIEGQSVMGLFMMTGAAFVGGGLTYLLYGNRRGRQALSAVTGAISLATFALGYDVTQSASNLQEFLSQREEKKEKRQVSVLTREDFKQELLQAAVKGTLTSAKIYDFIFKNKKL